MTKTFRRGRISKKLKKKRKKSKKNKKLKGGMMPLYSSIGRTQKHRNTHGHNITSRSNIYEDTGLRGEELAEHYMSIKNNTDEQANDICDDIDDRIDNALSDFLDAQEKNLSIEENNELKDILQDILDEAHNDLFEFKTNIGWGEQGALIGMYASKRIRGTEKKLNLLNTNINKIKCTEDGCACSIM